MTVAERRESVFLPGPAATEAWGRALVRRLPPGALVFLHGDLGAGKTALVRAILRGMGYEGLVKSPTYTILEPHELPFATIYHLDLYRLADSQELDFLGIDELLDSDAVKLIEWPERALDRLPPPDIEIRLLPENGGRRLEAIFHR